MLIDGDHSTEGVRRDIDAVLKLRPQERVVILMHDSFNPDCREGMRKAAWHSCAHVHYVELDFIPGIFHFEAHDTAAARSMWGGFACAVLEKEPRVGPLQVLESQRGMFEAVRRDSSHNSVSRPSLTRRVLRKLKPLLVKTP